MRPHVSFPFCIQSRNMKLNMRTQSIIFIISLLYYITEDIFTKYFSTILASVPFFPILLIARLYASKFFVFLYPYGSMGVKFFVGKTAVVRVYWWVRTIFACDSFFKGKFDVGQLHRNVLQELQHKHLHFKRFRSC